MPRRRIEDAGEDGKTMDDIALIIAGFDWLSEAEEMIFEDNARRVFKLDV